MPTGPIEKDDAIRFKRLLDTYADMLENEQMFIVNKVSFINKLDPDSTVLYSLFVRLTNTLLKRTCILRMNDTLLKLAMQQYPDFFDDQNEFKI